MQGEFDLIRELAQTFSATPPDTTGIGDDCAILPASSTHDTLVSVDTLVEDVHFRFAYASYEDVGAKSCLVNASDILAMGGVPTAFFVALSLPPGTKTEDVRAFYDGFRNALAPFPATVMGGDTTRSPHGVVISVTAIGTVEQGRAVLRKGARVGDYIHVLGRVGESAEGLAMLEAGNADTSDACVRAHLRPPLFPRLWERTRRNARITSAIDVSDGLVSDLFHILRASGENGHPLGAIIEKDAAWDAISVLPEHVRRGSGSEEIAEARILHGGEDYALLFTAPTRLPDEEHRVCVGRVTERKGVWYVSAKGERELSPMGYTHF